MLVGVAGEGVAVSVADDRELLLAFVAWQDGSSPTAGNEGAHVDEFLAQRRPGFEGFSDDELKGTARDKFDVIVGGGVLTWEALVRRVPERSLPGDIPIQFDEASGLLREDANALLSWLLGVGVLDAELRPYDDLSRPARPA